MKILTLKTFYGSRLQLFVSTGSKRGVAGVIAGVVSSFIYVVYVGIPRVVDGLD
jgi:hypothetical protein